MLSGLNESGGVLAEFGGQRNPANVSMKLEDPVAGLAGPGRDADGQIRFAGSWRAEEHHVVFGGDEVQRAQMGDEVTLETSGVVEVELLQ